MAVRMFSAFFTVSLCLLHVVPAAAGMAKSSMAVRAVIMDRPEPGAALADFLKAAHRDEPTVLLSRAGSLPGVISVELAEAPLPVRQSYPADTVSARAAAPILQTLTITY